MWPDLKSYQVKIPSVLALLNRQYCSARRTDDDDGRSLKKPSPDFFAPTHAKPDSPASEDRPETECGEVGLGLNLGIVTIFLPLRHVRFCGNLKILQELEISLLSSFHGRKVPRYAKVSPTNHKALSVQTKEFALLVYHNTQPLRNT